MKRAFVFTVIMMILVGGCESGSGLPVINISVVINEFMTTNSVSGIVDSAGQAEDWIEIYNYSDEPVSLKGLCLSDDSMQLSTYMCPDTIIQPRSFFVIWADKDPLQGVDHADFKLSAVDGDEIILSYNENIIDRIQFFATSGNPEARLTDISYGRSPDGSAVWSKQKTPTLGLTNAGP